MYQKVLLADDHSMIRKGIKLLLQSNFGLTEIGEVTTCDELMRELPKKRYTHLILDIILSDGSSLEILPDLRKNYPALRVMIASMQPPEIFKKNLKQYGIYQYLSKVTPEEGTIIVLHKFLQNEQDHRDISSAQVLDTPFSNLTVRELQILPHLLKGERTKEIAGKLDVKANTIATHKNKIFEKTATSNAIELMTLARIYGIYS